MRKEATIRGANVTGGYLRVHLQLLPLLDLISPGAGGDGRVGEVREGRSRIAEGFLHLAELLDVADLEVQRLGAGEAHHEEREAVAGQLIGAQGPFGSTDNLPNQREPEIRLTVHRCPRNDLVDLGEDVLVVLPEEVRYVAAVGEHLAVLDVERTKVRPPFCIPWKSDIKLSQPKRRSHMRGLRGVIGLLIGMFVLQACDEPDPLVRANCGSYKRHLGLDDKTYKKCLNEEETRSVLERRSNSVLARNMVSDANASKEWMERGIITPDMYRDISLETFENLSDNISVDDGLASKAGGRIVVSGSIYLPSASGHDESKLPADVWIRMSDGDSMGLKVSTKLMNDIQKDYMNQLCWINELSSDTSLCSGRIFIDILKSASSGENRLFISGAKLERASYDKVYGALMR